MKSILQLFIYFIMLAVSQALDEDGKDDGDCSISECCAVIGLFDNARVCRKRP